MAHATVLQEISTLSTLLRLRAQADALQVAKAHVVVPFRKMTSGGTNSAKSTDRRRSYHVTLLATFSQKASSFVSNPAIGGLQVLL